MPRRFPRLPGGRVRTARTRPGRTSGADPEDSEPGGRGDADREARLRAAGAAQRSRSSAARTADPRSERGWVRPPSQESVLRLRRFDGQQAPAWGTRRARLWPRAPRLADPGPRSGEGRRLAPSQALPDRSRQPWAASAGETALLDTDTCCGFDANAGGPAKTWAWISDGETGVDRSAGNLVLVKPSSMWCTPCLFH